jgi:hypothetical protein
MSTFGEVSSCSELSSASLPLLLLLSLPLSPESSPSWFVPSSSSSPEEDYGGAMLFPRFSSSKRATEEIQEKTKDGNFVNLQKIIMFSRK